MAEIIALCVGELRFEIPLRFSCFIECVEESRRKVQSTIAPQRDASVQILIIHEEFPKLFTALIEPHYTIKHLNEDSSVITNDKTAHVFQPCVLHRYSPDLPPRRLYCHQLRRATHIDSAVRGDHRSRQMPSSSADRCFPKLGSARTIARQNCCTCTHARNYVHAAVRAQCRAAANLLHRNTPFQLRCGLKGIERQWGFFSQTYFIDGSVTADCTVPKIDPDAVVERLGIRAGVTPVGLLAVSVVNGPVGRTARWRIPGPHWSQLQLRRRFERRFGVDWNCFPSLIYYRCHRVRCHDSGRRRQHVDQKDSA